MSLWRREAIERFPELHREIADIEGTYLLISQENFDMLHFAWDYMTPQNYAVLRREFAKNKERIDKQEKAKSQKSAFG